MNARSFNIRPVLGAKVVLRLWAYSAVIFGAVLSLALTLGDILGDVNHPAVSITIFSAIGLHFCLAFIVMWSEMRRKPTPVFHWLDAVVLTAAWLIGPVAWARARRKVRQSNI